MVQRGLKEAIDDLSDMSQNEDLNFVTKALPTLVNKHVFAKPRELGFNGAVGCLDFAINFPSIVDEVMKRITKLPFIFYTHPKSYYEVSIDFVKFKEMPTIPKPTHVSLPSHEIAKLHDYRKKWLEAELPRYAVKLQSTNLKRCPLPCMQQSHLKMQILTSLFFLVAGILLFPRQGKSFSITAQSSTKAAKKTKCLWLRGKIFLTWDLL